MERVKRSPEEIAERRAKRAERREKQRQANDGRALKMRKARLEDDLVAENPPKLKNSVHIGCSGWFYWHWKGAFYPENLPTNQWFPKYQKTFKTVELNAPFYAWPTIAAVKTWLKQAESKNFVYTVKNTHEKDVTYVYCPYDLEPYGFRTSNNS